MSTATNKTRLIEKLAKLKAQHEGEKAIGNIAAAESAAELFHTLLVKYKIDEAELEAAGAAKEDVKERRFDWTEFGFERRAKRNAFLERLAGVICRAHGAEMLIVTRSSLFYIISKESTYDVLRHALPILRRAAESLASVAYNRAYHQATEVDFDRTILKDFRKNFLLGFIVRLAERFQEIKDRKREAAEAQALVVISTDLVEAKAFIAAGSYGRVASTSSMDCTNRDAWQQGEESANSLNLEGGHDAIDA